MSRRCPYDPVWPVSVFGGDMSDVRFRDGVAPRIAYMPQGLEQELRMPPCRCGRMSISLDVCSGRATAKDGVELPNCLTVRDLHLCGSRGG